MKQSTHHSYKRRYQRLQSTDSKSHLAWAFIFKLCTMCISRQRNQLSKKMACGSSSNHHVSELLDQGIFTNARSETKMELPIPKLKRW